MSLHSLLISSSTFGSDWSGVLPFLGGIVAAALAYLGVRRTASAPLQSSVNDALRLLLAEHSTQHALDIARISELEGALANCIQKQQSYRRLLERKGIKTDPHL